MPVLLFFLLFYANPGLPVVLKFLKCHRCPEISNCPEILLIWSGGIF